MNSLKKIIVKNVFLLSNDVYLFFVLINNKNYFYIINDNNITNLKINKIYINNNTLITYIHGSKIKTIDIFIKNNKVYCKINNNFLLEDKIDIDFIKLFDKIYNQTF